MIDDPDLPPLTDLPTEKFELDRWLHVATGDLCESAKARVRAEVESHYHAAYEEMLREGLIDAAARAWAITALGDPGKARKKFNREYLTRSDFSVLKNIDGRPSQKSVALLMVAFAFLAFFIAGRFINTISERRDVIFLLVLIGVWAFQTTFAAFFGKRWPRFALINLMILYPSIVAYFAQDLYRFSIEKDIGNFSRETSSILFGIALLAGCYGWFILSKEWVSKYWTVIKKLRDKRNLDAVFAERSK